MNTTDRDPTADPRVFDGRPLEEPLADLERQLIDDYLRSAGHDPQAQRAADDPAARALLADASRHASEKLCEVEARSHYVHTLHGER